MASTVFWSSGRAPSEKTVTAAVGLRMDWPRPAICRTALELMGSRIVYRNAPGGGAEFAFTLRAFAAAEAVAEEAP